MVRQLGAEEPDDDDDVNQEEGEREGEGEEAAEVVEEESVPIE